MKDWPRGFLICQRQDLAQCRLWLRSIGVGIPFFFSCFEVYDSMTSILSVATHRFLLAHHADDGVPQVSSMSAMAAAGF